MINFLDLIIKRLRILALGYKEIRKENLEFYLNSEYNTEKDINFIGFLILENKLKSDSSIYI